MNNETKRTLPHPGSAEASAMMDSVLAEYNWPANTKNAARAGWEAANRWLVTGQARASAATQAVPVSDADEFHAANQCVDAAVLYLTGSTEWPSDWLPLRDQFLGIMRSAYRPAAPVLPPVALPALTDDKILHLWDTFVGTPTANLPLTDADKLQFARAILAASAAPAPEQTFQQRVRPWMMDCFGPEISSDVIERNHRFLEEALELVQSTGCTAGEAHQLVDYVYGRPAGETAQEVGGVMVTLAALCLAHPLLDMHVCGEIELARIWTKVEQIRAKQAAKPKHSPLPGPSAPEQMQPNAQDKGHLAGNRNEAPCGDEAVERDAARYRWLRVRGAAFDGDQTRHLENGLVYRIGNLDDAIDAVMQREGTK